MENSVARDFDKCRKHGTELDKRIAEGGYIHSYLEEPLLKIREACSNALLTDYKLAEGTGVGAENRLWASHQKVNSHFRAVFSKLKNSTDIKTVELRKARSEYVKFLKTSQIFYRAFIPKLSEAYGGIPALQRVAKKFNHLDPKLKRSTAAEQPTALELEDCCHKILTRLGDLSRYREAEISEDDEKHWETATGYYDLAICLNPGSGAPFNQLAIMSIADRGFLRALYYTYRALTAADPWVQALDNLRRVMNLIQKSAERERRFSSGTDQQHRPSGMVDFFLRLIEQSSRGIENCQRQELEQEVLTQFKDHMKKANPPGIANRMVISSIAAQFMARSQSDGKSDNNVLKDAYTLFLQLNLKIFISLLQVLETELDEQRKAHEQNTHPDADELAARLTPVTRRVLPLLRLYNSWLLNNVNEIANPVVSSRLRTNFWEALARCLTGVRFVFPTELLPKVKHLLEEEEDTLGFMPLYVDPAKTVERPASAGRQRWHEISEEDRNVPKEMLYRTRELVLDGLRITMGNGSFKPPMSYDKDTDIFLPTNRESTEAPVQILGRSPRVENQVPEQQGITEQNVPGAQTPPLAKDSQDLEAERMVDSIVGLSEASTLTPPSGLAPDSTSLSATSTQASTLGIAIPFSAGSSTVADIMQRAFQRGASPANTAWGAGQGSLPRPNSRLQSPVRLNQSLPPRVPSYDSERSGTDYSNGQRGTWDSPQPSMLQVYQMTTPVRGSPLPPPHVLQAHSRGNSNEGPTSIWSTNAISPVAQPMSRRNSSRNMNLGNGTFGAPSPSGANYPGTDYGSIFSPPANMTSTPWDLGYKPPSSAGLQTAGSPPSFGDQINMGSMHQNYSPSPLAPTGDGIVNGRADGYSATAQQFRNQAQFPQNQRFG